jgi:hypothetical protein
MSFNIRKKNPKKSQTQLLRELAESYSRCVVALQEARTWLSGPTKAGAIFGDNRSDCKLHVPFALLGAVEREDFGDNFQALQIGHCMIINLHLPCHHPQEYNLDKLQSTFMDITKLITAWRDLQQRVPVRHIVMAGDFNTSLPSDTAEVTGTHIFQESPSRSRGRELRCWWSGWHPWR